MYYYCTVVFFLSGRPPRCQADHLSRSVALLSLLKTTPSFSSVVFSPSPVSTPVSRPVHRRPGPKTQIPARRGVWRALPCRAAPVNDPCAHRLSWSLFGYFGAGGCLAWPLLSCSPSPPSIRSFSAQTRPNEHRDDPWLRQSPRKGVWKMKIVFLWLYMTRQSPSYWSTCK